MARLKLRFLGTFEATLDDAPLSGFRSDKVRALLAYLAVEAGRPHRREAVAALLWGEHDQRSARVSLRKALSNLRKTLASLLNEDQPLFTVTRQSMTFHAPHAQLWSDVVAYTRLLHQCQIHPHPDPARCTACIQRLSQAADLYRGDFLEGLLLSDSPAFDEWRLLQQEKLHQQMVTALDTLVSYHTAMDDHGQVRTYARRLLDLEPWNEEAHRRLMVALAQDGRRNEALAQYEACRRVLAQELGVEPATETTTLYESLVAGELPREPAASPVAPPLPSHNLPSPQTPFIGRTQELAELRQRVLDPAYRLLTITGEGGMGKTRLALATAARMLRHFGDGVWFVSLADAGGNEDKDEAASEVLVTALATALDFTFQDQKELAAQLLDYLRQKSLLLVVDNVEPFLEDERLQSATTRLVQDILDNAANVTILATSRQRLNLQAEYALRLAGMPVPPEGAGNNEEPGPQAESVADTYDSVQLFLERARRVPVGFELTPADLPDIVQICRLAEGLPLAIELAAGWVEQYTCAEIAAIVQENLDFLATRLHDLPVRHRSMRAVFAHSWDLLSPPEQRVLAQASVFRGSFSREAALTVTDASLPDLISLVDQSLFRVTAPGRYSLHSLVRQFAGERLQTMEPVGQLAETATMRHSRFYLALVADHAGRLRGAKPQQAVSTIRAEIENVRRAWQSAVANRQWEAIERSALALSYFYLGAKLHGEGAAAFASAIEQLRPDAEEAEQGSSEQGALSVLLVIQAHFSHELGDYDGALTAAEEGLRLAQRNQADGMAARAHSVMGIVLTSQGKNEDARQHLDAGLERLRRHPLPLVEAEIWRALGALCWQEGAYAEATSHQQRALHICREIGDAWGESRIINNLANALYYQEQYDEARRYYERSLTLARQVDQQLSEAVSLINLGVFDLEFGRLDAARDTLKEALAVCRAIGVARLEAVALNNLGLVSEAIGVYEEATATFRHSLHLFRQVGYRRGEAYALLYLGNSACHRQDHPQAIDHAEAALRLSREINEHHCEGLALDLLGEALMTSEQWQAARERYLQALALREERGPALFVLQARAGLAQAALRQKQLVQAQAYVTEVLTLLQTQEPEERRLSLSIYWTCYQVLQASNDPRAEAMLDRAHTLLQERASLIGDDAMRRAFLESVPLHQTIREAYISSTS